MDNLRAWGERLASYAAHCGRRFADDRCMNVAASLSYTTLLSLVPLMTIAFSVLAAFPVFDAIREQLQSFLFENFVASAGATVEKHLGRFTQNTGQLTAVGIAVLAVTALLLLNTIENAFNQIWRVVRKRPVALRFIIYWAILTLAPMLLGTSVALSSYLFALGQTVGADAVLGPLGWLLQLVPFVLVVAGLAVMYKFLPFRRVALRDAALGALVGAVLFELLKKGFGLYVASFPSYETIYGALSALPLFLIWMYLAWSAVLFGAEVAASGPEWRARRFVMASGMEVGRERMTLALAALGAFAEASRSGKPLDLDSLSDATGAPPDRLDVLLRRLDRARFVSRTAGDEWVLSRDLDEATLYDLYTGLELGLGRPGERSEDETRPIARILDEMERAERNAMAKPLKPVVTGDRQ